MQIPLTADVAVTSMPRRAIGCRAAAVLQFPGGYIAEVHSPAK
jgi:hypothetical protein